MRSLFIALGVLALAAGPALAAAPPAKPAPAKPAAAKPAAAATPGGKFDARDPDSIIALMATLKAKATVVRSENGQVFMNVSTENGGFGAQMIGCDPKGKGCAAIALFTVFEKKGASLDQINSFNRSQLACRGVLTPDGRPSVVYSTLVNARMPMDETRQHLGVWQGCLVGFGEFLKDPTAFLSKPH